MASHSQEGRFLTSRTSRYCGDGSYPPSYYAASANPSPPRPALTESIDAEICVIGAGYSGLSTALHLAEAGHKVVVLEGARVGWGASGRNGGQIVNGLNASLGTIERRYGPEIASFVGRLVQEGGKIIRDFVSKYDMLATEPLGQDRAKQLLPTGLCVEDVRYILDYFRLSADNRLIFGGGTVYGGTDPADVIAKLRPNLQKVYPQLKDVRIDYAWSGNFALSFSRVPQMGRLGANTYFAHGNSGHGVTGSHLFGRILSEAVRGDLTRFDVFAKLPWYPFPGGRTFRAQYSALGSWYYSLRDRLGI
jgi:glycine/D-amino acid oxidase-like deaminating enzyme